MTTPEKIKNQAAVELGRLGGKAGTGASKARPSWQARQAGELGNKIRWAAHNAEKRNKERSEKK